MKKLVLLSALIVMACACSHSGTEALCDYVDMRIGTGGHGHVFMGASVPYGMVQLGPTSVPQDWDWCSGYHGSDSTVIGFSHTHLSGTGIGDLFDITVMPIVGEVVYARGKSGEPESGLWSYADRCREVARPGYYRVPLVRYGIDAELTATPRVGMHRYTFPASDSAALVFDLANGGCWDRAVETMLDSVGPARIEGYRYSRGWARDQRVYFVAEFSKPMTKFSLRGNDNRYGQADFATEAGEQVLVKVAISPVSIEGAARNLEVELPDWDFDSVAQQALNAWESEIGRLRIDADDADVKKKFYTSLYHTMIAPSLFCDVDGNYRGADGCIYQADGFKPYTVLSLWDTYRAALPLMSLFQTERYADVINTMVDIAGQQGRLPVWHLWGNETDCMVGNPGTIAVADAIVRDVEGIDPDLALQAMLRTAADTARGGALRAQYGFIPADLYPEAVACDLEYAIADGALALSARHLGHSALADSFDLRSKSYRQYFDTTANFARGRLADLSWREPFDPRSSSHRIDDFCEGNAWQYTWLVPHDVQGLADCFGSKEVMLAKLDSLFTIDSEITGEASPDISGMIGQYAHGNEPGHHIIYLYSMLGEHGRGAHYLRRVMREMYTTAADGLCGNEDAGQMSAWYVLSAIGLYQVEPGSARYWIGSPIVDRAVLKVPGGQFVIEIKNNGEGDKVVKRAWLNGEPYELPYVRHADIMAGGTLVLEMN